MTRQINMCWSWGCIIDLQWPSVPSRSIMLAISNTRTSSPPSPLPFRTHKIVSVYVHRTPAHTYVPRVNYSQAQATPCYSCRSSYANAPAWLWEMRKLLFNKNVISLALRFQIAKKRFSNTNFSDSFQCNLLW